MRVLVAGCDGQLGRSLPTALEGHEVIACNRKSLDITNPESVAAALEANQPEVVINAAAWNRVDDAETEVADAYRTNAVGPRNLAEATAARDSTLIHVSTDYVFDGESDRAYTESDIPRPRSVYGASKLAGEEAVRLVNPRHHIVRTAWVFHEHGNNFPRTMIRLSASGKLQVVDDQIGSPTYAPHLASGIAKLLDRTDYGLWHLAGSGQTSWFGFTQELVRLLGLSVDLRAVGTDAFPRPAHRPAYAPLATERQPGVHLPDWQEGLAAFCSNLDETAQG